MTNFDKIFELNYGQENDILEYCEENEINLELRSTNDMIDAWLKWNGIHGYTQRIIDLVETLKKLENN